MAARSNDGQTQRVGLPGPRIQRNGRSISACRALVLGRHLVFFTKIKSDEALLSVDFNAGCFWRMLMEKMAKRKDGNILDVFRFLGH